MHSATHHVGQTVLPVLLTSDIKHVLPRADRLRAERDQEGFTLSVAYPPEHKMPRGCQKTKTHPKGGERDSG